MISFAFSALICSSLALLGSRELRGQQRERNRDGDDDTPCSFHRFPFPPQSNTTQRGTFKILLVWDSLDNVHTTIIAVGTPPQLLDVAVDLTQSTTMLVAAAAKPPFGEKWDWPYHCLFRPERSSTFVYEGTPNSLVYHGIFCHGRRQRDTFELGGFQIRSQWFHLIDQLVLTGRDPAQWTRIDGVLGLGPGPPMQSGTPGREGDILPPILGEINAHGHLAASVMSLRLPLKYDQEIDGEILFGGSDPDKYHGELTRLRLTKETDQQLASKWTVNATAVQLGPVAAALDGYTALIDMDQPHIALPRQLVREIRKTLGARRHPVMHWIWIIPCEVRATLPDFTIYLDHRNFTLSGWDYTEHAIWKPDECTLAFLAIEDTLGPRAPAKPTVVLGAWFLRLFYAVFDMNAGEVGFARMKRSQRGSPQPAEGIATESLLDQ